MLSPAEEVVERRVERGIESPVPSIKVVHGECASLFGDKVSEEGHEASHEKDPAVSSSTLIQ